MTSSDEYLSNLIEQIEILSAPPQRIPPPLPSIESNSSSFSSIESLSLSPRPSTEPPSYPPSPLPEDIQEIVDPIPDQRDMPIIKFPEGTFGYRKSNPSPVIPMGDSYSNLQINNNPIETQTFITTPSNETAVITNLNNRKNDTTFIMPPTVRK